MKAISLWQPWASLWLSPFKVHETRHWSTRHRGWLAVHAAKRIPSYLSDELIAICEKQFGLNWRNSIRCGYVLGAVYLDDCSRMDVARPAHQDDEECGNWSPDRFGWRRRDQYITITPVPFKGRQRIFDIPDTIVPSLHYGDVRRTDID